MQQRLSGKDNQHMTSIGTNKNQFCEDYPCCGHEMNDCNGTKYGSDEAIKEKVWKYMARDGYDYGAEMGDL